MLNIVERNDAIVSEYDDNPLKRTMAMYLDNYMLGTLVVPLSKGLQSSNQYHRILHNIALQQGTYITAKEVYFIVRLRSSVISCLDRVLAQYF